MLNIYNIVSKKFHPLDCFPNLKQTKTIIDNYNFKKRFFPFPILMPINRNEFNSLKSYKIIEIFYNKIKICDLRVIEIFEYDLSNDLYKLFFTNDYNHPGFLKIKSKDNLYISGKFLNTNERVFINILKVDKLSNIKKILDKKNTVGFHTRNIPHLGHEWIHRYCLIKYDILFLNPIVGDTKNDDFNERKLIRSFKKYIKLYPKNRVIFSPHFSTVYFAGPRETLLHLLIRKNLGCKSMVVGRDHSGVKNYYGKYQSQDFAKKFEKKIGIKVEDVKEPYFCSVCNLIVNISLCSHSEKYKTYFSGTEVRKKLKNNVFDKKLIRKDLFT